MTNSDYLLKAAIKKVTEKLNEILVDKIEEATNIAQDAPEILKKEFDSLKESIIEEASRLEKAENIQENESTNTYQDSKIKKALNEIEGINKQIDLFNKNIIEYCEIENKIKIFTTLILIIYLFYFLKLANNVFQLLESRPFL